MSRVLTRYAALSLLSLATVGLAPVRADKAPEQTSQLKLEARGVPKKIGFMPIEIPLVTTRPAKITKEPVYKGTPRYGTIHLGNGPKADTFFAVDMPDQGDYKIYVDKNQNGDLTDDGDGAWSAKREGDRPMYGVSHYTLHASYGTAKKETHSADYGVGLYQFVGMDDMVIMYREAAAVGTIKVAGKAHKMYLLENDTDALFSKPIDNNGKAIGGGPARKPVWLLIDTKDTGKFTEEDMGNLLDVRAPFTLNGKVMEAVAAADGTQITLKPTARVAYVPKASPTPKLLAAGVTAPDFTVLAADDHAIKLSDYKGKVIVLDFWATWCGPCQEAMPHIEKVYQAVKDKDVVVLGVCVSDKRKQYDRWILAHKDKYTFDFAFDPSSENGARSISNSLYHVSGIPTTYIIDKDGKVVEAIEGYEENDKRVEAALKKAGVEVEMKSASSK